jgi:hypothetical protein
MSNPRVPYRMATERKRLAPPQTNKPLIVHLVVNVENWPFDQPMAPIGQGRRLEMSKEWSFFFIFPRRPGGGSRSGEAAASSERFDRELYCLRRAPAGRREHQGAGLVKPVSRPVKRKPLY